MTQQLSSAFVGSCREEISVRVVWRILDRASKSSGSMKIEDVCHEVVETALEEGVFFLVAFTPAYLSFFSYRLP
jgi:hypothetical protein